MKKIIIVTNSGAPVPAVRGGAVENLVETLLRKNEANPEYRFVVYTPKDEKAEIAAKEFQYAEFRFINDSMMPGLKGRIKNYYYFFINHIYRKNYHGVYIERVIADLKARPLIDAPILVEHATLFSMPLRKAFPESQIIIHLHNDWCNPDTVYYRPILKSVNQLWGISDYIVNRVRSGCPAADVKRLYNGVDERFFAQKDSVLTESVRKRLDISPETRVILYSGRLNAEKGVQKLVDAYAKLNRKNILLLILGGINYMDNTLTPYAKHLYESCERSPNPVKFTGYIPYDDIAAYYHAADFCVMPSEFEEPFGMVAVEAMACGLPMIATRAGGLPEIVNEECGIVIENDESVAENLVPAMETLLDNRDLLRRKSIAAKERAKLFTADRMDATFRQLLRNIIREED